MNVPVHCSVYCRDGYCGRSTYVILSPLTDQVTHVVVESERPGHLEQLIPVALIDAVQPHAILLACDRATLGEQDPFIETQYIRVEDLAYGEGRQRGVVLPNTAWRVVGEQEESQ